MRKQLFLLAMTAMMVFVPSTIFAQRHFYNRIELGAGNVWGFVGTSVISNWRTSRWQNQLCVLVYHQPNMAI